MGTGILRNAESCQGVICGKSSAERSANYPLSLFRIPQPKNSAFPQITKVVRSSCTTDVQPLHSSVRHPAVLSFRILCGPFATEQGSCFIISTNFKVPSAFQVSCHFASRCDWFWCDSRTDNRTKPIMFNSCDTGRYRCRMTAAAAVAVATDRRDDLIV